MWWWLIGLISIFVFRAYEEEPISIIWYPIGTALGPVTLIAVILWMVMDIKL